MKSHSIESQDITNIYLEVRTIFLRVQNTIQMSKKNYTVLVQLIEFVFLTVMSLHFVRIEKKCISSELNFLVLILFLSRFRTIYGFLF